MRGVGDTCGSLGVAGAGPDLDISCFNGRTMAWKVKIFMIGPAEIQYTANYFRFGKQIIGDESLGLAPEK